MTRKISPGIASVVSAGLLVLCAGLSRSQGLDKIPEPKRIDVGNDPVQSVILSADGKTIITLGPAPPRKGGDEVRIWNVQRGTNELLLEVNNKGRLVSMAWQPGGKLLAVRQYPGPIHMIDVPARKKLDSLPVYHSGAASQFSPGIDFSSDGKLIAVAGGTYVEVFDAANLTKVARFHTHIAGIDHVLFRPAAKGTEKDPVSLVTMPVSPDLQGVTGQLWDVTGKKREMVLYAGDGTRRVGSNLAFSSDGKFLAQGYTKTLLWDFEGDLPRVEIAAPARAAAFRPNSNLLALGESAVELWDIGANKKLGQLGDAGFIVAVAFSADGNTLVAANSRSRSVLVWDVSKFAAPPPGALAAPPSKSRPEVKSSKEYFVESVGPLSMTLGVRGKSLEKKMIVPATMEVRLLVNDKEAELKDFREGDIVELFMSTRRYPSVEVRLTKKKP